MEELKGEMDEGEVEVETTGSSLKKRNSSLGSRLNSKLSLVKEFTQLFLKGNKSKDLEKRTIATGNEPVYRWV